jgi:glycosyltransferase involved in cell wall biosynthesis
MSVSVNILNWNCGKVLKDSIDLVSKEADEVIVVDNGSNDGTEALATIRFDKNRGVSIGKNAGIEASKGDYILLLDGDILYVPNTINCMVEWLELFPHEYAIGFYPNKFARERDKAEAECRELYKPSIHTTVCLFYGMFRRSMFTDYSIKCDTSGPFALPGYGWEDTDLYYQMKDKGIKQWVAGLNTPIGKYYHEINSSIRQMGSDAYIQTSKERHEYFKEKWTKLRESLFVTA